MWVATIVAFLVFLVLLFTLPIGASMERAESAFLRRLVEYRTEPLNSLMLFINGLGAEWSLRILRWGVIIALIAVRRWRHLLVFLGTLLFVAWLANKLSMIAPRPRPYGVEIIGPWEGFAAPSAAVAALAPVLAGVTYTLAVPGRPRRIAKWASWFAIAWLAVARIYLGVDHPSDIVFALILGWGIPLVAYRVFTPNSVFPVRYKRGRAAHLDVSGRRGQAIRQALAEQLGIEVLDLKLFGLQGSGGSTPMRLEVAGEQDRYLFGKLYAKAHLRADRWYKVGRTILYGTLEDEKPYNSVRRLVQYEDYVLRVMHDAGLPCARSYGFVEITPEREYLLVTRFLEEGVEISETEVDDEIIDDALAAVRTMWEAGLAHRDIKPANILVRDKRVFLIDPAFGEIRPSPWREAVDLANMMLVLALRADADHVHRRALELFTEDEISEAFAATKGVTMPTQVRNMLRERRKQGEDILGRFRQLAKARRPISIQRWSVQRVGVLLAVILGGLIALGLLLDNLRTGAL